MNKNIEQLAIIIGHRFPRFWFDSAAVQMQHPDFKFEDMVLEIAQECYTQFSAEDQKKIDELVKEQQ